MRSDRSRGGRSWPAAILVVLAVAGGCGRSADVPGGAVREHLDAALRAHAAGDLDTAARQYRRVLDADGTNKFAHYNLGLIAQTRSDRVTAEREYRIALETDADFAPA